MSTALRKYERLEATALWRAGPDEQRREVIVSIGRATLVMSDMQDRPLTHWSLPALVRANPGEVPAIYHPDGDAAETLELGADEDAMVEAIETLQRAIHKRRPRSGRLRWGLMGGSLASVLAVCVFWLPGALVDHAASVLPTSQQQVIGSALLERLQAQTSTQQCDNRRNRASLDRLAARLQPIAQNDLRIAVLRGDQPATLMLPGDLLVINAELLERHDDPDVAAGYILAELLRAQSRDPLHRDLSASGLIATLRLMTTGDLDARSLDQRAAELARSHAPAFPQDPAARTTWDNALIAAFRLVEVKSSPYGYALDPTGETTLSLIEADPYPQSAPRPVLTDGDWLRLQAICEG